MWVLVSVRGGCQCAVLHHHRQLPLTVAFRGGHANKRICTTAGYEPDMDEPSLRMVMVLRDLMVLQGLVLARVMAASDGASHGKLPALVQRPPLPLGRPDTCWCRGPATQARNNLEKQSPAQAMQQPYLFQLRLCAPFGCFHASNIS